ncbi:MAG: ATP-dependent DNA helicase Rep, partial [Methyloprofundus sp.]|nr:ATP-dependent DNA helicase Rep [Methyloprofundus sp.]
RQRLPEGALARLQKFCQWTHKTASALQSGDLLTEMNSFIQQINYHQWLQENSNSQKAAERRIKNVCDLLEWLERISKGGETGEAEKSLDEVVSKIQLMDILERNQDEQADSQVSLMTLHAAKGLEFPHVFLIGFEENILPHQASIDNDNIEEERRLAYVGITRAQQTCTFSYCTHRKRYGDISESDPSRFLAELPEEDLEWASKVPINKEEQKERGKANLAHLKSMLSS